MSPHKVPPWCINLRVCSQPVEVMIQIHPLTIKLYNKQSPLLVGKYSINLQNCNISPTVKSASLGELPLNPTQPFYHVTLQWGPQETWTDILHEHGQTQTYLYYPWTCIQPTWWIKLTCHVLYLSYLAVFHDEIPMFKAQLPYLLIQLTLVLVTVNHVLYCLAA